VPRPQSKPSAACRWKRSDRALRAVRPGDLVLIKGSRGIRTDVVVDRLKVEFA
jgi:UDP-N-acetylmuramyl pentapeptide synthase